MVKFLVQRPIGVLMTTLGLVILGLYAFTSIPVSLMPDINIPEITVQINADNMSSRQLQEVLVNPLARNLSQIKNLKDLKSETRNGFSLIRLNFSLGTNIEYSFIEVNEKIDLMMGSLSKNFKRPKVIKASSTDIPMFYLNMTLKKDKTLNATNNTQNSIVLETSKEFLDFNRFVSNVIRKRIEQVKEVAMVDVSGLLKSEILIIPNSDKIEALGISLDDLESVIKQYNLEIGNFLIKDGQYQYNISLGNSIKNIKEVENIYISKNNKTFLLKDIAKVLHLPQNRTGLVLADGEEAITMAILKQSDARMDDLKFSLEQLLTNLESDYPNIVFSITRNQTKLLEYAINNLTQSLLFGVILSFIIMFLFLKNIKSPLLIGISIPISIIICILIFYILEISINIISLSGLVLGVGLMIDNSIIVIDNITHHFGDRNNSLLSSCVKGANEVFKPLLSSALTTCAVFLPLIFLSGIAGVLFYDQAMAITIGLLVSLLVSMLILPVLFYIFHRNSTIEKSFIAKFLEKTNTLDYGSFYEKGFRMVIKNQKISWSILLLLMLLAIGMFGILPKTKMPIFSSTETLLKIDWNEQINIEENKRRVLEILALISKERHTSTALVGRQQFLLDRKSQGNINECSIYISFDTPEELKKNKKLLHNFLKVSYKDIVYKFDEVDNIFNIIFSSKESSVSAHLKSLKNLGSHGNENLKKVLSLAQQNLGNLKLKPIIWEEQLVLESDHEKLLIYDVSSTTLYNTLRSAFNEREIISITSGQDLVPVKLGAPAKSINSVLNKTHILNKNGVSFPIKEFVRVKKTTDLKTIMGGIDGEYVPLELEIASEDHEGFIDKVRQTVAQNAFYEADFTGSIFENKKLVAELAIVLTISLLMLYLILVSQFESFLVPLIILIEVPIDIAGSFLLLKLFGMTINLMSMIGIVVMCGIIINDSILKLDLIIQLQKKGTSLLRSLLIAGKRKLKPILMTSLTTILALMPLLFSSGIGAELQAPLAISLIGGMILGTFVSLYFIPLGYYTIMTKIKRRKV